MVKDPHLNERQLIESLPEGVFTIDTGWRITSFNRAAAEMTGFKTEEAIGRHCWEIFHSDLCHKRCPLGIALETAETRLDEELTVRDRSGTRKTLLVNVSVLRDERGKIIGAVETFRPPAGENPAAFPETALSGIVGRSEPMREILRSVPEIAASGAHVLISGESGTGKELLARAIHALSRHRTGSFMAVNCSALAESLLESELFGHEKGAFTGAGLLKPGRFETAAGGTLFLDEIGELRPELQVKLLRVLEQRVFERVGGSRPIAMNARIIGATHLHLGRAVDEGRFREDLYYRLRTIPITLPPLRERQGDVPLLVAHFIQKFNARYGKNVRSIDPKIFRLFSGYRWPGNVRELERFIEHAFVFVKGPVIFAHHLPDFGNAGDGIPSSGNAPETNREREDRNAVLSALSRAGGRRSEAAAFLGISRTSMWRRMQALGITRKDIEKIKRRELDLTPEIFSAK